MVFLKTAFVILVTINALRSVNESETVIFHTYPLPPEYCF